MKKIIGKNREELSLYLFDVYSLSHIIFGHLSLLIIYFFGYLFPYLEFGNLLKQQSLFISLFIGIVWELFENNILIKTKLKNEQDSLNNSLFDIICVFIGIIIGVISIIWLYDITLFMLITTILFMFEFLSFVIMSDFTFNRD